MKQPQERYQREYVRSLEPERLVEASTNNEGRSDSHPAFLSDAEFAALPDWYDVENDSAYSTKHHRSPTSSLDATCHSAKRGVSSPPGSSSTSHFVASLDNPSQIDLNRGETTPLKALPSSTTPHPPGALYSPLQLNLGSRETTLVDLFPADTVVVVVTSPGLSLPPYYLGSLPSASSLELRDPRKYPQIAESRGPRSQSGSIVDKISSESERESDYYHFGDGMPPRDLERFTTARTQDGQRSTWMVTPGRPPISEAARAQFSCRGHVPQCTHYVETELLGVKEVSMRGGAGSEDEGLGIRGDSSHTLVTTDSPARTLREDRIRVHPRLCRPVSADSKFIELMDLDGGHLYEAGLKRSRELSREDAPPMPYRSNARAGPGPSNLGPVCRLRALSAPNTAIAPTPSDTTTMSPPRVVSDPSPWHHVLQPPLQPQPPASQSDVHPLLPRDAQTSSPLDAPSCRLHPIRMMNPRVPQGGGWGTCCDPDSSCYVCIKGCGCTVL
jgi:hypothetical protein